MSDQPQTPTGPDHAAGSPADSLGDGVPFLGHVQGEPVILENKRSRTSQRSERMSERLET